MPQPSLRYRVHITIATGLALEECWRVAYV